MMDEKILFPFLLYYYLFGKLLPFGKWVIGSGIILIIFVMTKFKVLRSRFLTLSPIVRWVALVLATLGALGTMPTSFLYGTIGGEIGAALGTVLDDFLSFLRPLFSFLGASAAGIISVTALVAWALVIWGSAGGIIGWFLNAAYKVLKKTLNPT